MGYTLRLDKSDRKIISMFAENPRTSQDEIARELKISQPSVAGRIKRLRDIGALEMQVGLDPEKMNLHIGKVDIATTNTQAILEMFRITYEKSNIRILHDLALYHILGIVDRKIGAYRAIIIRMCPDPHLDPCDVSFREFTVNIMIMRFIRKQA